MNRNGFSSLCHLYYSIIILSYIKHHREQELKRGVSQEATSVFIAEKMSLGSGEDPE